MRIEQVDYSDELFAHLLAEAPFENGAFLTRLRDDWLSGEQRFSRRGELLLGAFSGTQLVGVGGVSEDPYAPAPRLGRIRHLYVLTDKRRQGIGRSLMQRLLEHARAHFDVLRLSTTAAEAARLYESLGFEQVRGEKQTHRLGLRCPR